MLQPFTGVVTFVMIFTNLRFHSLFSDAHSSCSSSYRLSPRVMYCAIGNGGTTAGRFLVWRHFAILLCWNVLMILMETLSHRLSRWVSRCEFWLWSTMAGTPSDILHVASNWFLRTGHQVLTWDQMAFVDLPWLTHARTQTVILYILLWYFHYLQVHMIWMRRCWYCCHI